MTKNYIRFTFRLPAELKNRLQNKAKELNISLNSLIIAILDKKILEESKNKK